MTDKKLDKIAVDKTILSDLISMCESIEIYFERLKAVSSDVFNYFGEKESIASAGITRDYARTMFDVVFDYAVNMRESAERVRDVLHSIRYEKKESAE